MEKMFSPWRSHYIQSFSEEDKKKKDDNECFLCSAAQDSGEHDAEMLVVARRKKCFVIMNRFPYNGGHIMVVPYTHSGEFTELPADVLSEIMLTLQDAVAVLQNVFHPDGFNIGANLGRVAGAGVPGHIHFHVVPRWNGDTNFMPVLADVKVVSESLTDMQEKLAREFSRLEQ